MVGGACCETSNYPFPPSRLDVITFHNISRTFSSSSICSHLYMRPYEGSKHSNATVSVSVSVFPLCSPSLLPHPLLIPPQILSGYLKRLGTVAHPKDSSLSLKWNRIVHWGLGICFFRNVLQPVRIEKHRRTCLLLSLICSFAWVFHKASIFTLICPSCFFYLSLDFPCWHSNIHIMTSWELHRVASYPSESTS